MVSRCLITGIVLLLTALFPGFFAARAVTCSQVGSTLTCTGGAGASVNVTTPGVIKASPYPAVLAVTGGTGTVTGVQLVLHGVNADGTNGSTLQGSGFLLASPSGRYFEVLHAPGNGGNESATLMNDTVNLSDSNSTLAPSPSSFFCGSGQTCTISNTTFNWKPTSYTDFITGGPGTYPSPAPPNGQPALAHVPSNLGSATFASVFTGDSPNGTWNLYMENDDSAGNAVSFSSWDLILTLQTAAVSTTTTVSSSLNPTFTSGANSTTTFTATVSGGSGPTGTVTFSVGGVNLTCAEGAQPIPISNGAARCTTSFNTEGFHTVNASYNPTGSFLTSNGSVNQFSKNHSQVTSGAYCNPGLINIPGQSNTSPYPSIINVGTDTAAIANSLSTLTVTLRNLTTASSGSNLSYAHMLLVAPDNTHAFDFLSFAGGAYSITSAVNLTLDDNSTNGHVPANFSSAPSGNLNYLPTSYSTTDTFPSPLPPAPAPPSTFGLASPAGGTAAKTFTSEFNGVSANGDWKLFVFDNSNEAITVGGGWCMNFTQSNGTATVTSLTASPNPASTTAQVTLTATVLTANTSAKVTTGTVTFTENGSPIPGASANTVAVDTNGNAVIHVNSLSEGDHNFLATYEDASNNYSLSFSNFIERVDNATTGPTVSGNTFTYCNTGTITLPGPNNASDIGPASPNPSNIFVKGLPGTITSLEVDLKGLHMQGTDDFTGSLLVGPSATAAETLDFFTNVGNGSGLISGNFSLVDSASGLVPTGSEPAAGTYKPSSYGTAHTYTSSSSGFYTVPTGTLNRAAPAGSSTLNSVFGNTNGNGTWSLYFDQNIHQPNNGLSSGWCVDLTITPPVLTITKSHTGPGTGNAFIAGQTGTYTLTVGNSGPGSTGGQTLTVSDALPTGVTQSNINGGSDWNCASSTASVVTCTSSTVLSAGNTLTPIVITVTPAATTGASVNNSASVSGASGITGATSLVDTATVIHSPILSITNTDNGSPTHTFKQGDTGKTATFTISNASASSGAGPTTGTVTVTFSFSDATAIIPQSITPPATGWSCQAPAASFNCVSSGSPAIAAGASLQFVVGFNVSATSGSPESITAAISGGGGNTPSSTDTLTIVPGASLSITKSHTGNFTQGSTGVWNLQVNNAAGASTTVGTTTVSDALPNGYTLASFSGTGWSCSGTTTVTCTTTAAVAGGAAYNLLALTVNVPAASPVSVSNTATVFGGGDPVHANAGSAASSNADRVTVNQVAASLTADTPSTPQSARVNTAFSNPLAVTVKDANAIPVVGVTVTFTAPASGASGTFANGTSTTSVITDANGRASATVFTANGTPGMYTVTASTPNNISTGFSLTNTGTGVTITTQPTNQSVCAGSNAVFTAAASGVPTPTVQWQVNSGSGFTNISGATSTTLTLTAVTASMNGYQYQAVFTNPNGTATTNAATLTVNTAPVVTTNPLNQTVVSGQSVSFTAAASGSPAPSVQWQVSTNGGSAFANIAGATSPTLTFVASSTQNGNQYRAVFTGTCGAATTTAATLTVTPATGPAVVSFSVLFGTQSYSVTGSSRNRLPWQVSGIRVVFSEPITSANVNSLSGVATTGFSGLGTNTLTWTMNPISLGNVAAALAGSGANAIKDAGGTGLNAGSGATQNFRVLWGDFNDDGIVNSLDTVAVNNATVQAYNILADLNGDGVVNSTDARIARAQLGTTLP